jgi:tetratricopeptide (TPR) repeat protein
MEERDSGKVFDAIEKFEYILSRRPSLNRARLELAVSYHRASQYDDALREFQTVLDNPDTPEKVRLAILAYLGQLTSDEVKPRTEHSFSYYTKAGVMYNTNINFAPLRGTDTIPDGQDTASPGLDTFLSASHRYKDNKPFDIAGAATHFEWQSQVSWTGNNYTRNNDFSLNILSASTGPAFISTGRWTGAINLQLDQTYFGSSTLGTFVSLNPLITFDLGNYRGLTFELSYTDNDFKRPEDEGRDGNTLLGGAAYSTLLGDANNGLEVGFRLTDHTADDDQFGFSSEEIYLGGFITIAKASNVYLNLNFEQYEYDAADQLASNPPMVRDEIESRYVLGYNYDFSGGYLQGWTLNTHVSYTRNNSNVDYYNYDRKIFAINLARYFI